MSKEDKNSYEDCYSYSEGKRNKPVKKTKNKVFINIVIVVLCLVSAVAGSAMVYYYRLISSINYEDSSNSSNSSTSEVTSNVSELSSIDTSSGNLISDPMVLNVMLFGSDHRREGDPGRSDSMILISLDNRHKKIKITSLMRDIWVHIPGYSDNRLNVAYSLGGPKKAIETVERNFGIKIDRYAIADFSGFEKIVNRLGGVDIELTKEEVAYINKFCGERYTLTGSGMLHLNGEQALNHARNRDSAMSDFDRTKRQRQVLKAIISKFKTANISQITGIVADVGPMITTNLRKDEISTLVANSLSYLKYDVEEYRLPQLDNFSNKVIKGMWVLSINDMNKARYDLAKFIYEGSVQ